MWQKIDNWIKDKTGQDIVLIAIILIFLAGMVPLAATRVIDSGHLERYYTDGALSMLQSNDFLTPYGDAKLRLYKPPLLYWLLIAGYKLLGVSFFSSRIWSLGASCATIWLAYKLALKLTNDIRVARTTALILLSNLILISIAARSTLDALLTFSMFVSAYGFIRLICFNETQPSAYWAAYAGAAIGIATKGLLPILFVAYALVFACFTSSPEKPFRRVLNPGIILASILIACSWMILMFWKHGTFFLRSFWYDQIGQTIDPTGKKYPYPHGFLESNSVARISGYFLVYILVLLPWLLCLAYLFYKHKPKTDSAFPQGRACLFIVIWALLLAFVFGLGYALAIRYLLPAIPALAVVLSIGLCQFSNSNIAKIADRLLGFVIVWFFAVCIFGLSILWQNGLLTKHFAGLTILLLALLFVVLQFQKKQLSSQAVLSVSLFFILPLSLAIASPFTLPDQTGQIASALQRLNPEKKPVFVIGTSKVTGRLRVSSGAEYPIHEATVADFLRDRTRPGPQQSIFVLTENEARQPPLDSLPLRDVSVIPSGVSLPKLFRAMLKGNAKAYIDSRRRHCYAVLPASS